MATLTAECDISAGSAVITAAVDTVSPGADRRIVLQKIGSKLIIVGYDIA